jgi:hypothetical protein
MTTTPTASTGKAPRRSARLAALIAAAAAVTALTALPAFAASPAPALGKTADVAAKMPRSVTGVYTLHFSWGCFSYYDDTSITFNAAAGTFATGDGGKGIFGQADNELFWQYTNRTTYGGIIDGSVGSGASSTTHGLTGCWYLTAPGTTGGPQHAAGRRQAQNSAGTSH